ncbi:MAG: hypothetical protein SFW09_20240 [Hyphomicrobiaceae bacterium]|nr:hypothetical protein [Hyphomicrobiaceae bacterium]
MQKRVSDKSAEPVRKGALLPFLDASAESTGAARTRLTERAGQRFRRRMLALSFLAIVILPTVVTGLYYAFIAAPQFAAESRVSVRSASNSSGTEVLGIFSNVPLPGIGDSYIVMDFVRSRQILDKLAPSIDYRSIFNHPNADFLARLDPQWAMEDTVKYWRQMVTIGFDTTSQIITLKVRTFTPEDALKLSTAILAQSEELINALSARARADAVKAAEQEVQHMEGRLRTARAALQTFRETRQELDPRKKAEARQEIIEKLQSQLTEARAKYTAMRQTLSENAPSVIYHAGIIKSLEQQIEEERERIASSDRAGIAGGKGTIGGLISDYEALATDREFAEKAYLSALSSLERARFDAARQHRYLATIVEPALPDDAQYPKRILNTLIVLAVSFSLWALASLVSLAVRDHVT